MNWIKSRILLFGCLCCLTFPFDGSRAAGQEAENPPAPDAKPAESEPEFKDDKAKEAFAEGRKLFDEKKYKESTARFQAARKGAGKAPDVRQVDRWLVASQCGLRLESVRQQAARGSAYRGYLDLDENLASAVGTPIEAAYRSLMDELAAKVLVILEDFETPSKSFSANFGKSHIKDPTLVYHGKGCIEWKQTDDLKAVQLRIAGKLPKNWNNYAGLVMWMYVEKGIRMEVILKCPGKSKEGVDSMLANHEARPAGKWERVFLEFGPGSKFTRKGKGNLGDVEELILQVPKKDFKLRVDCIALVKRDAGAPAPPAETGKKK